MNTFGSVAEGERTASELDSVVGSIKTSLENNRFEMLAMNFELSKRVAGVEGELSTIADRLDKIDVSVSTIASELKSAVGLIKTAHKARVRDIVERNSAISDSINKIESKKIPELAARIELVVASITNTAARLS